MMVIGLSAVLYVFLDSNAFFINSMAVSGESGQQLKYLLPEEVFRYSELAQQRVFWVDPEDVEARLEQVPNIAKASVYVGWPPNMIQIEVIEREPALVWQQGGVRVWVDVRGNVMKLREDRSDLILVNVANATEPVDAGSHIPKAVVDGVIALRGIGSGIEVLNPNPVPLRELIYDPIKGLGYEDSRHWTVWFGDGDNMDVKLMVYEQVVERILTENIQPEEIVMSDPDRPYYRIWWRNE